MIKVEVANRQSSLTIQAGRLKEAVRTVLTGEGIQKGAVSVAVVDNPTMHELNRRYLQHDYPTDVLTFVFKHSSSRVEGEIVVNADYAVSSAPDYAWSAEEELLLYVVHGALHLAGYEDEDPEDAAEMRERERLHLHDLGVEVPDAD